jgi:NAD(P)-dependent dehydrogenase (short-subunit alcohol dehydrogenase family)
MTTKWTANDMPSLEGQVWIITGANSGLGLESSRALAAKGATVVMGCRDPGRAQGAADDIKKSLPAAKLELESLDLASLKSIEAFAAKMATARPRVHGLINNAGVMATPPKKTADGFELQLGTNHLGHFALTLRLLPLLEQSAAPRVVTVSSEMHKRGNLRFDDLMLEKSYAPWNAYGNSKLANLLFTYELARKLAAAGKKTLSVAAHPGYAATNLQGSTESAFMTFMMGIGNAVLAQSAAMGALPQLLAATGADVKSGDFFGPGGFMGMKGHPVKVESNARSKDTAAAEQLWKVSEQLTGVVFPS